MFDEELYCNICESRCNRICCATCVQYECKTMYYILADSISNTIEQLQEALRQAGGFYMSGDMQTSDLIDEDEHKNSAR